MRAYMDSARTTRLLPEAREAMAPYLEGSQGVSAGLYAEAVEATEALERAAAAIARVLGVRSDTIAFTSGATEANNMVLRNALVKGGHAVASEVDHPSVMKVLDWLARQKAADVARFGVDRDGTYNLESLAGAMRKDTRVVALLAASHVFGTIEPVREAVRVAREAAPDAIILLDAACAFGYMPMDLAKLDVDAAALSSHKLHGPKGVGALYVREGRPVPPLLFGEASLFRHRQGAENVAGAVGFAAAVEACHRDLSGDIARMAGLRDRLIRGLLEIPHTRLNGHPSRRLCNNANITFDFVEGEAITFQLDTKGVCVATGSACASEQLRPNYALMALGLRPEDAHGSIRFTISRLTTEAEVDHVLAAMPGVIASLRRLSSVGSGG